MIRFARRLMVLVLVLLAMRADGMAPAESIEEDLLKAKKEYSDAIAKATRELRTQFDAKRKAIENKRSIKIETRIEQIEQLEEEWEAFSQGVQLPRSTAMKPAKRDYMKSVYPAKDRCEKAYSEAINAFDKQGDIVSARRLLDEKELFCRFPTAMDPGSLREKWTPLFNRKNLSGWKPANDSKTDWVVKNGVIETSGGAGYLLYERNDFEDFRLRVMARVNEGGNGGVFFRVQGGNVGHAYEAQINSRSRDPNLTGSIYVINRGVHVGVVAQVKNDVPPPGQWFAMEVVVRGHAITVFVNGVVRAQFTDPNKSFSRGGFALQHLDGNTRVSIAAIELMELTEVR